MRCVRVAATDRPSGQRGHPMTDMNDDAAPLKDACVKHTGDGHRR
jgi:hypothetical protein